MPNFVAFRGQTVAEKWRFFDENQLARVETSNFMRVVGLCLIPITGFSHQSGFQLLRYITTRFYWAFPVWDHLSSFGTSTLNLYHYHTRFSCSISYAYDSLFSTFSSIFSYVAVDFSPYIPFSSISSSNGQWGDLEWFTPHQCSCPAAALSSEYSPNRHGPKIGGGCALFRGGDAGPPSNTMWRGLRPTSVPSFVFIQPLGHNTPTLQTWHAEQTAVR